MKPKTPIGFLRELKADPLDPTSPFLLVAKGDLSTAEAEYVTGDYGNRTYALYLEEGNAETFEFADETTERVTVFDIILEKRCTESPTPQEQASMLELFLLVSAMPSRVTHLMPGRARLFKRLKVGSGLGSPRTMTDPANWLTAGLRFEAHWRARF